MKNLAKLQLETQRQKGKTKPMATARTARAVPQMRKVVKTITGRKNGGTMTKNPTERAYALAESQKDKDRLSKRDIERAEKLKEKQVEKLLESGAIGSKEALKILGKRSGGVIRPKPTYKGKVLKPKPIKRIGVGAAIRGFGKAFKKGR